MRVADDQDDASSMDSPEQRPRALASKRQARVVSISQCEVNTMLVDRRTLRKSARHVMETYLVAQAPKEINVPQLVRQKVQELVERDRRYDPMLFSDVREHVFDMMRRDSYARFLKHSYGQ
jgi:hypothetical protein